MRLFEETVDSQTLFEGHIIKVRLDLAKLENGKTASREVVEELPAGKLDGPEDHEKAARRELSEEVGVEAGELRYLGCLLASPGFCTEVLHMYFARDLRHTHQHPDEDEFLEVERVPFDDLYQRVLAGEVTDAKSVAIVLKVKELLRREAGETA